MISRFRKSANNIFIRIFLFLIAISFLGFGASIYVRGNSSGNAVSFTQTSSISVEEYEKAKNNFIREFQQASGMELKAENIDEFDINYIVLKQLVHQKMVNYLAEIYGFDISNEKIIKKIKTEPMFMTDDKFDLQKFKNSFRGVFASLNQYSDAIKTHIISSTIETLFKNLAIVSDLQLDNLIHDVSEKKITDIVIMDLNKPLSNYQYPELTEDELSKFYQDNISQYTIAEKRKFRYLKMGKDFVQSKLEISEELLNNYYNENIEEYGIEHFNQVKHIIEENYTQEKTNSLFNELAKNVDEDIASGMSFDEIAAKYNLQEQITDYLTIADMTEAGNKDYEEVID
ncbi:MAG: SurA N-terminal domain-containing protein [Rickettsiaceae bacterium]|nr:SurA N-terminal domain-containing protein [Rickettsiaceae bacterium]